MKVWSEDASTVSAAISVFYTLKEINTWWFYKWTKCQWTLLFSCFAIQETGNRRIVRLPPLVPCTTTSWAWLMFPLPPVDEYKNSTAARFDSVRPTSWCQRDERLWPLLFLLLPSSPRVSSHLSITFTLLLSYSCILLQRGWIYCVDKDVNLVRSFIHHFHFFCRFRWGYNWRQGGNATLSALHGLHPGAWRRRHETWMWGVSGRRAVGDDCSSLFP